jgi:hypothetical protein
MLHAPATEAQSERTAKDGHAPASSLSRIASGPAPRDDRQSGAAARRAHEPIADAAASMRSTVLFNEVYKDLGLNPNDLIPLPYPNVGP